MAFVVSGQVRPVLLDITGMVVIGDESHAEFTDGIFFGGPY